MKIPTVCNPSSDSEKECIRKQGDSTHSQKDIEREDMTSQVPNSTLLETPKMTRPIRSYKPPARFIHEDGIWQQQHEEVNVEIIPK